MLMFTACASPAPTSGSIATVSVPPGGYAAAFDAARTVLRDRGFILERVDAQAGIITTQPKTTGGLATPWDREQQSFRQEAEDMIQRQQRIVRVSFDPADGGAEPATMQVQVTLQRVHIPGQRLEPEAIGQSTYFYDPALGARGMQPQYAVSIREDTALAERLAGLIRNAAAARAAAGPEITSASEK